MKYICPMGTLKIRNARPSDVPFLFKVFERAIRQTASADYSPEQVDAWVRKGDNPEGWSERIRNQFFLVAVTEDGSYAGFSSLASDGYLDLMFVDPDWKGKGVAGLLINHILSEAKKRGIKTVCTDASITARDFFTHHGFTTVRKNTNQIFGITINNYRMKWVY